MNTAKSYRSDLREFLKFNEQMNLSPVKKKNFEDRASAWLNSTRFQVAPKTTCRRLTSLRSWAKWAWGKNELSEYSPPSPGRSIPHPLVEGVDGIERMLRQATSHDYAALVSLCGYVGLRVGEALTIKYTDFDLHTMMLTVRGKGDKTRIVPVSPRAWEYLTHSYIAAMSRDTMELCDFEDRAARKAITVMGKRAGLSRAVSSHDLRATFATTVFNHTGNQRVVQELLGHAQGTTTEIYIGVVVKQMVQAVDF